MLLGYLGWSCLSASYVSTAEKNLVKTQGCMKQEAVRCSKFQDDWTCLAYQPSTNFATLLAKKKIRKIVLFFEPNIKHPKLNHHTTGGKMSTQETHKTTVDFWILDPSVKLKSKNVNTKYCEKLTKSNSSMHCFVNTNPILILLCSLQEENSVK